MGLQDLVIIAVAIVDKHFTSYEKLLLLLINILCLEEVVVAAVVAIVVVDKHFALHEKLSNYATLLVFPTEMENGNKKLKIGSQSYKKI